MSNQTRVRVKRSMDPKYVKRRQRGLAVLIASFILIIGVSAYIAFNVVFARGGASVDDYDGNGNGVVAMVQIKEGDSISSLGPELEGRGIVASDSVFQTAAASNPDAGNVQPGFYRLEEEMSAQAAVAALLDPAKQVDLLDVHGGATLQDVNVKGGNVRLGIYSQISNVSCADNEEDQCVSAEELASVAANKDPADLGAPEWALDPVRAQGSDPKRLEGLIAPGQYVIDPSMDAEEILTDLVTRTTKRYNDSKIVERARAVGLEPYELLIAASLVEREAPAGDFDKVARVILNRLDEPMRLEFDSTVNYGLDDVELATSDEDRARQTPWNTYAMDGLPATPIAAPSDDALHAMEHPAEGNWLFFVTIDNKGTTVFNDTFEKHLEDVDRALESGILDHHE
ncbi:endolytic transglycosylase MltG [Corynebacterium pseudodiphtheriticum]|uniref:endolytic transglycosylase MltG n=1 Tax=Corynebacterium pseudodiphtheriticum TaxID=37637 RepID=UPI00201BF432|nr:endolytic transglycosylase MltG [Corynebacterium pseudodiphtheriticum]UQV55316.1 endolytic transglycosylase MltG [Corynebacterium pseudodiphtheriticum]